MWLLMCVLVGRVEPSVFESHFKSDMSTLMQHWLTLPDQSKMPPLLTTSPAPTATTDTPPPRQQSQQQDAITLLSTGTTSEQKSADADMAVEEGGKPMWLTVMVSLLLALVLLLTAWVASVYLVPCRNRGAGNKSRETTKRSAVSGAGGPHRPSPPPSPPSTFASPSSLYPPPAQSTPPASPFINGSMHGHGLHGQSLGNLLHPPVCAAEVSCPSVVPPALLMRQMAAPDRQQLQQQQHQQHQHHDHPHVKKAHSQCLSPAPAHHHAAPHSSPICRSMSASELSSPISIGDVSTCTSTQLPPSAGGQRRAADKRPRKGSRERSRSLPSKQRKNVVEPLEVLDIVACGCVTSGHNRSGLVFHRLDVGGGVLPILE